MPGGEDTGEIYRWGLQVKVMNEATDHYPCEDVGILLFPFYRGKHWD